MAGGKMVSTAVSKKSKTLFTLDSPYTQVKWPAISLEDRTTILDMLCGLLSPIGDRRARHVFPSRGKRKKKRKRGHECTDKDEWSVPSRPEVLKDALPAPPDIQRHVTIGFNATTKHLENLAKRSTATRSRRNGSQEDTATDSNVVRLDRSETDTCMPLAAVFVPQSDQHAMLYAHIPLLAKITSSVFAAVPSTRLVVLSKGAEQRLGSALAIPRVGVIGLSRDAPESAALMEFVKQRVPEIEVPWLDEVAAGSFLPVKIDGIETSAPLNKSPETALDPEVARHPDRNNPNLQSAVASGAAYSNYRYPTGI